MLYCPTCKKQTRHPEELVCHDCYEASQGPPLAVMHQKDPERGRIWRELNRLTNEIGDINGRLQTAIENGIHQRSQIISLEARIADLESESSIRKQCSTC